MKMDEHARAWGHEFVGGILAGGGLSPEQRSSLHWEILSHLHEKAERRVEARRGDYITLADLQAVVQELGGRDGIAAAFLQTRVVATPRAGFGKRLGAFLVDVVLVVAAIGLVYGIFVPFWVLGMPWAFPAMWEPLFSIGVWYGYLVVSETRWGATVGKMAFKLKVVGVDGRPATAKQAFLRNIAKAFPPLLVIDVVLWLVAFNKDDQRASDRLAETIVIDTSRPAWAPAPAPVAPPTPAPAPAPGPGPAPVGGVPGPEPEFRPGPPLDPRK